ncbi:MAG: hypothetical protein ABSH42_16770 [Bryobacteraceae bacterium]|jgi:hypothetical protein
MSVYDPLKAYLETQTVKSITFTFGEIEAILGRTLPRGAYNTDSWWTMQTSWREAGWQILTLDRGNESVRFSRQRRP